MKYLIIFINLILLLNCNRSKTNPADLPNKDFNLQKISGEWKIIPSNNLKLSFSTNDTVILNEDGIIKKLVMKPDSFGLRISDSPESANPRGYFLFSEHKEEVWHGVWEEQMVKLLKETIESSTILE